MAGKTDTMTCGRQNTESPGHKIMSLLRVSPVESRSGIQIEWNAVAGVMCEVSERYKENSNYREDGVG